MKMDRDLIAAIAEQMLGKEGEKIDLDLIKPEFDTTTKAHIVGSVFGCVLVLVLFGLFFVPHNALAVFCGAIMAFAFILGGWLIGMWTGVFIAAHRLSQYFERLKPFRLEYEKARVEAARVFDQTVAPVKAKYEQVRSEARRVYEATVEPVMEELTTTVKSAKAIREASNEAARQRIRDAQ